MKEDFKFLKRFKNIKNWTEKEAAEYEKALEAHDLIYHIDDDAKNIIWSNDKIIPNFVLNDMNMISKKLRGEARERFFDEASQYLMRR